MTAKRYLIVNADDFGQSLGVNRGIIEAHEHGIVTSTSMMVRWPAAVEAAAYGREHPELSIGLHFDLYEWTYQEESWKWEPLYEVVPANDITAVAEELSRQLEMFRQLLGRDPTHIDSHQHVHRAEPICSIVVDAARSLGVPLRDCSPEIRYSGEFYGQTGQGYPLPEYISVDALLSILAALPPGITELGCHPGLGDDLPGIMYRKERAEEVKTLCDPQVRAAIVAEGIELCSFRDITSHLLSVIS